MADFEPRVLVVDDERFFREAIREALASAGIDCEIAEDARSALAAASEASFAVAVVDVGLPESGGIEVLKGLRDRDPTTRVIVLSAPSEQDAVLDALRLDATDYLAKPLHDEELVLAVRRALSGHAIETRFAALRDRICDLDARAAALVASANDAPAGGLLSALGPAVAEAAAAVLGASKTSLLVTSDDGSLHVAAAVGSGVVLEEMDVVMPGESIAGLVLSDGEPFVVSDLTTDPRFADRAHEVRYRSKSLVVTPVGTGVRPFGVLCATDRVDGSAFAAEDLALLRLLAAQVGQLLAPDFGGDARPRGPADALQKLGEPASSESAGRVAEAELARTVCDALTSEIEPDRLITASLSAVSQSLAAAPVALYLIDNQSGRLCLEAQVDGGGLADHASFERMRGLTGLVLQTGQPVAADHPDRDARFDAEVDTPLDGAVRPLICAPVKMRGKTMGLVRAFLKDGATASAATAEVVSAVISAAVRNVFLYRSLLESIDEVARVRRDQRSRR